MVLTRSLSEAVGAVRTTPSLLLVSFAVAALQAPSLLTQPASPASPNAVSLGASIVSFLVGPIMLAGGVALAADALDGGGSLGSFAAGVREHALRVFLGYVLLIFFGILFGVAGLIALLIAGAVIGAGVLLSGGGGAVGAVGVVVFLGLIFAVFFLPTLFVHFFGHAIVLDDQSVGDAFRRSFGVARGNLLGMLGYGVILFGFSLGGGVLGAVGSLTEAGAGSPNAPALTETVAFLPMLSSTEVFAVQASGLVLTGLFTAMFWPFSVAVYRRFRDRVVEPETPDTL